MLKVVKILYYRFEFARGDSEQMDGFGAKLTIEYSPYGRKNAEKKYPRIANRDKFLSPLGTPTYLDDLKRDLRSGGPAAKEHVKNIVEYTGVPFCPSASVMCASRLDPFFPSHRDIGKRLLEYIRQLFDVQEYLIDELRVRPGSLLPVWLIAPPDDNHPFPTLGIAPVRRSIIDALTEYILWELEIEDWDYLHESPWEERNNQYFFDNALRWGRTYIFRQIRESDIEHKTGVSFFNNLHKRKAALKKLLPSLPDGLRSSPLSWAQEVLSDLNKRGELAKTIVRKFTERKSEEFDWADEQGLSRLNTEEKNAEIVQSPTFITRINRAVKRGICLFEDRRNFW